MSENGTYNGWTNRETWAVALHINNDQGWQESVHEAIREDMRTDADDFWGNVPTNGVAARRAGDIIRENVEELFDVEDHTAGEYTERLTQVIRILTDIGSLWRVNWTELGASFLEGIED